jgi:hypothetical protein
VKGVPDADPSKNGCPDRDGDGVAALFGLAAWSVRRRRRARSG